MSSTAEQRRILPVGQADSLMPRLLALEARCMREGAERIAPDWILGFNWMMYEAAFMGEVGDAVSLDAFIFKLWEECFKYVWCPYRWECHLEMQQCTRPLIDATMPKFKRDVLHAKLKSKERPGGWRVEYCVEALKEYVAEEMEKARTDHARATEPQAIQAIIADIMKASGHDGAHGPNVDMVNVQGQKSNPDSRPAHAKEASQTDAEATKLNLQPPNFRFIVAPGPSRKDSHGRSIVHNAANAHKASQTDAEGQKPNQDGGAGQSASQDAAHELEPESGRTIAQAPEPSPNGGAGPSVSQDATRGREPDRVVAHAPKPNTDVTAKPSVSRDATKTRGTGQDDSHGRIARWAVYPGQGVIQYSGQHSGHGESSSRNDTPEPNVSWKGSHGQNYSVYANYGRSIGRYANFARSSGHDGGPGPTLRWDDNSGHITNGHGQRKKLPDAKLAHDQEKEKTLGKRKREGDHEAPVRRGPGSVYQNDYYGF